MEKGGWDGSVKEAVLASWRGEERESGETEHPGQRPPNLGLTLEPSPNLGLTCMCNKDYKLKCIEVLNN